MNCEACWHLRSLHGPGGCTAKVYPAHSLTGEPCPCEQVHRESRVIKQARKRAAELFEMAEDPSFLGI